MSRDEITLFREGRPHVAPYDPDAKARAHARLLDAAKGTTSNAFAESESESEPRRHWMTRFTTSRRLLAVGALTAAMAVGITVVQNIEMTGEKRAAPGKPAQRLVLGPVANAEDLAVNAARTAAAKPDDRPKPGQWAYLKTVLASSSKGVGGSLFGPPDRRMTKEVWRSVDGKGEVTMDKGRLQTTPAAPGEVSPRSDYPYLLSLPTDPDALLAEIYRGIDREGGFRPGDRPARAFEIIEIYMRDAVLPARLRAAMYGALAKIPGVRYDPKAADIAGRPGVTLYRIVEGYLRSEILIDPKTYEYMGFRFIAIRSHVSKGDDMDLRVKKGQILGWGGLVESGIVNKPGQRP